jgi:hypothetical protein
VRKVLEPIWATKRETASRVRGRIESVLDWAKVAGYRTGENPARWRGHLKHSLAAKSKTKVHLKAMPFAQLPGFMAALRKRVSGRPHFNSRSSRSRAPSRRSARSGERLIYLATTVRACREVDTRRRQCLERSQSSPKHSRATAIKQPAG